jgi:hypothetical protein
MESHEISSGLDLLDWLDGRPSEWVYLLTLRPPLRALAHLVHKGRPSEDYIKRVDFCFRANVLSWIAAVEPKMSIWSSITAAYQIALKLPEVRSYVDDVSFEIAMSAAKAMAIWEVESRTSSSVMFARECVTGSVDFAAMAAVYQFGEQAEQAMWQALQADCLYLENSQSGGLLSSDLAIEKIWLSQPHDRWFGIKDFLSESLLAVDPNYSVWIDWYERRIRGERAAFDIPGDKGRIEDKKILRRLAEATDEDFWGKGHEYVNATLKGWLDEARARHAVKSGWWQRTFGPSTDLDTINPDPQDGRSPQFGSDATGRIAIRPDAGADQLRSDIQSLSRHARALQMAQRLAEALRNHNNAGYMTEMASDYVAAMEGGPDGPDPSGLVFAGDQLREAIAKHRVAGVADDLQPLPLSADRDASAFLSAHNMYVGSDPFLDDLDRTTRGPDAPLPTANPDEIRRVTTIARDDDILAEPTYDYIIAASEAAPANYDQTDRHSRFAAGLAQNFARYGIELLWAYPNEAAWASLTAGAVVTVALGPLAAAGGAIGGIGIAYHLARNMIANEAIYNKLLATSPAGEDNFNRLMRFLKSLPIKSLKDD